MQTPRVFMPYRERASEESPRLSEISGLGSLRKGWMNNANLNSINGAEERTSKTPRVVIVGGGFGGLTAAKALGKAPVEVILIDRTNHHVFQPLLYQAATSVLAPSQMSSPIREVLRRNKNTTVIMGEVT